MKGERRRDDVETRLRSKLVALRLVRTNRIVRSKAKESKTPESTVLLAAELQGSAHAEKKEATKKRGFKKLINTKRRTKVQ